MKHIESFKVFKVWMYSLIGFDVFMFAYLMISGRVLEEFYLIEVVNVLGFIVLITSALVAVTEIIYAIVKKEYNRILIGVGIAVGTFVLFVWMLVLALASWS